ncbi:hypothetical protein DENSPDRAFT_845235 [Dentipellis sp. KUC8613]|nr:hypothetical protein DENSPDRAFT_845235 [Dentipellis sp. KUC8613]
MRPALPSPPVCCLPTRRVGARLAAFGPALPKCECECDGNGNGVRCPSRRGATAAVVLVLKRRRVRAATSGVDSEAPAAEHTRSGGGRTRRRACGPQPAQPCA